MAAPFRLAVARSAHCTSAAAGLRACPARAVSAAARGWRLPTFFAYDLDISALNQGNDGRVLKRFCRNARSRVWPQEELFALRKADFEWALGRVFDFHLVNSITHERWSVRTQRKKIQTMTYERTAISKKPDELNLP